MLQLPQLLFCDFAEALPADVLADAIVPEFALLEAVSLSCHNESGLLLRVGKIRVGFCYCKEPVEWVLQEPGDEPILLSPCSRLQSRI